MKFRVAFIFLCLIYGFSWANVFAQNETVAANDVLRKVSDKLASLKTVNYTFRRELNFESTGFVNKTQIESFLDFTSDDKIIGAKFQFDDSRFVHIFNGSEFFALNKQTKKIAVNKKPNFKVLDSLPGFYDSLVTLKNSLPKIVADKTIPKTVAEKTVDGKKFYVAEFVLDSKILQLSGDYFVTMPRKFTYRLTIDQPTYLPIEVLRTNDVDARDFTRTEFAYKQAKAELPNETSWFYSTYLNEYKPEQPWKDRLIKVGQIAPDWKLPSLADDALVSLSQHKNKVVLIEFWISFCGYCIEAVPKLNRIEEKFKNKDFKLVAVNASDAKNIIQKFVKNNQPKFQILHGGAQTAEAYGADAFPSVVLIDKGGKIIYSGVLDAELLEKLISQNI